MKTTGIFIVLMSFLLSCSSPNKTTGTATTSPGKITKTDVFRGGTSFDNPVVIRVTTEKAGVAEEYKWLSNNYPGYTTIRKTQASKEKKRYDIIRIKTKGGEIKDIYFDTTSFFGNP
ncbi:MAG: hypothetical protein JNK14_12240 [Chitinophagaceae bacterium]|nr:hypothetical protein [Chitinophagaceae bacterium]